MHGCRYYFKYDCSKLIVRGIWRGFWSMFCFTIIFIWIFTIARCHINMSYWIRLFWHVRVGVNMCLMRKDYTLSFYILLLFYIKQGLRTKQSQLNGIYLPGNYRVWKRISHWGLNIMAVILQAPISNAFRSKKIFHCFFFFSWGSSWW